MDRQLKEIIRLSDVVRKKYSDLKRGRFESEEAFQKAMKPVVSPFEQLASQLTLQPPSDKSKKTTSETAAKATQTTTAAIPDFLKSEEVLKFDPEMTVEDIIESKLQTTEGIEEIREHLNKLGNIAGKYLALYITGDKNIIDKTQIGIRHNGSEWVIGDSKIGIDNNDIIILDKEFEGSEGLYELLFMRNPNDEKITEKDVENYREILKLTNANRRSYSADKQIQGLNTAKYKKYVAGKGLKQYTSVTPNYIFWNEPNELVQRLMLLTASEAAGHSAHVNEKISIIEELREANIIE